MLTCLERRSVFYKHVEWMRAYTGAISEQIEVLEVLHKITGTLP